MNPGTRATTSTLSIAVTRPMKSPVSVTKRLLTLATDTAGGGGGACAFAAVSASAMLSRQMPALNSGNLPSGIGRPKIFSLPEAPQRHAAAAVRSDVSPSRAPGQMVIRQLTSDLEVARTGLEAQLHLRFPGLHVGINGQDNIIRWNPETSMVRFLSMVGALLFRASQGKFAAGADARVCLLAWSCRDPLGQSCRSAHRHDIGAGLSRIRRRYLARTASTGCSLSALQAVSGGGFVPVPAACSI